MNMMWTNVRSIVFSTILVITMVLPLGYLSTPVSAAEPINLRVQSWGGATYSPRVMVESVIKKLNVTDRFKITYFPGEPVVTAKEAFDAVREGVLDVAITAAAYHEDRMGPVGVIQWMPRNFNFEKFAAHYRDQGGFMDFVQPYYGKVNLHLLSDMHTPPAQLFSTKPVKSLDDLKGLLIRDAGSQSPWLKLLGAAPLSIPSPEVFEGFQRGVVEGTIASMSSYVSNKWFEVATNVTEIDWLLGGMQLVMNQETYEKLPADARELLDKAVLEAEQEYWNRSRTEDKMFMEEVKAKGANVIYPDKAGIDQFESAIEPFYTSMSKKFGSPWDDLMKIRKTLN